MKTCVSLAFAAVVGVALCATSVTAGTLRMTFKDSNVMTYGTGADTYYVTSPVVTLSFANAVDYALLPDPKAGPKFGAADLVSITWENIENLAFIERNPAFENPPLTQALFDTLTFVSSRDYPLNRPGIFAPVDGAINARAEIYFAPTSTTTFITGPMVNLQSRGGNVLKPSGNWDSDRFSDAAPWLFGMTAIEWDPSATSFAVETPQVPLPAAAPLLIGALGGLALFRRKG